MFGLGFGGIPSFSPEDITVKVYDVKIPKTCLKEVAEGVASGVMLHTLTRGNNVSTANLFKILAAEMEKAAKENPEEPEKAENKNDADGSMKENPAKK